MSHLPTTICFFYEKKKMDAPIFQFQNTSFPCFVFPFWLLSTLILILRIKHIFASVPLRLQYLNALCYDWSYEMKQHVFVTQGPVFLQSLKGRVQKLKQKSRGERLRWMRVLYSVSLSWKSPELYDAQCHGSGLLTLLLFFCLHRLCRSRWIPPKLLRLPPKLLHLPP